MDKLPRLREKMKALQLDAIIVFDELNARYLSGYAFTDGYLCISQNEAQLVTDFRYYEAAIEAAAPGFEVLNPKSRPEVLQKFLSDNDVKRLGFEGGSVTYSLYRSYVDKYPDIGEKISPIAVVISNDLPCYVLRESERKYLGFPADKQTRAAISELKSGLDRIFCAAEPMKGNKREVKTLINSNIPDAFDMLNEGDGRALSGYEYIVEGGLHWMVNKRADGGYYLAVFNHSGVVRDLRSDEHIMAEETRTVTVDLSGKELLHLEGDSDIEYRDGKYLITVRAGDFFFGSF